MYACVEHPATHTQPHHFSQYRSRPCIRVNSSAGAAEERPEADYVTHEAFETLHAQLVANGFVEQNQLSHSNVKQTYCALRLLQELQHHAIYGAMLEGDLTTMRAIKMDLRQRRQGENARKAAAFIDACSGIALLMLRRHAKTL